VLQQKEEEEKEEEEGGQQPAAVEAVPSVYPAKRDRASASFSEEYRTLPTNVVLYRARIN